MTATVLVRAHGDRSDVIRGRNAGALRLLFPREGDLLVVNKTDLAPHVGADLDVMARDARAMRGDGPTVFAQVTKDVGVAQIARHVLATRTRALAL